MIKSHVLYRLSYALAPKGRNGKAVVPDLVISDTTLEAVVRFTGARLGANRSLEPSCAVARAV